MRHRHHHDRHHRRRWSPAWILARGIHRTVFLFGLVALSVGAVAGAWGRSVLGPSPSVSGLLCLWFTTVSLLWPLGWAATWRIARPLRRLAAVAGELQGGQLDRRSALVTEPGEVGEVSEALRGLADRLATQLRDQRALMAAVSHELRSPLGRARVLVEMAREGSAPPTLYDELDAEIAGMDGLVGDLLAAARINFEAIAPRELSVRDVAARALELAHLPSDSATFEGEAGELTADATLLARALSGLLDNGRRYGGTQVSLTVQATPDRVRFLVKDNGPGFAPGDEERAFEPFWRGPTTTAQPPRGEGLGLALVRQIARAHQGDAGAANSPTGGAHTWIDLPRGSGRVKG